MSSDSVRSPAQGSSFAGLSCLQELSIKTRIVQGSGSDSEENFNGYDIYVKLAGLPRPVPYGPGDELPRCALDPAALRFDRHAAQG